MDAAKARFDGFGQHFGQLGDRQARGVAGNDRMGGDKGGDLLVQIELPVHPLGNRLDDQVAAQQQIQVLFVIGLLDQRGVLGHTQRRGLELFQAVDRAADDAVLRTLFGRQIEQDHRQFQIDQMRGNLRAHHACAEHSDFTNKESTHGVLLKVKKASLRLA